MESTENKQVTARVDSFAGRDLYSRSLAAGLPISVAGRADPALLEI